MSSSDGGAGGVVLGLYLIGSAAIAVVAVSAALRRTEAERVHAPAPQPVPLVEVPTEPIRSEAQVFRTSPGMLAIEPDAPRERSAHPRRLATVHFLRSYEGAPPRIPHDLTAVEFRTFGCKTCHERGGYSVRFTAYVPVTPHPERGICLQCHVGVDSVIGALEPNPNPNIRCPMCHGPTGGPPRAGASLTWATTVWPVLPVLTPDQSPPPIPHDLQFRQNCLTCHAGPAAVAEIRSKHPDRADCRGCHLAPNNGVLAYDRGAGPVGAGGPVP
jgi:nitrate reductase (cytochrome), electron transfer subunit